jgi:hypothetical protein
MNKVNTSSLAITANAVLFDSSEMRVSPIGVEGMNADA